MQILNERIYTDNNGCMWLEINYCEHFKLGKPTQMVKAVGADITKGKIAPPKFCWTVEEARAYYQSKKHDEDAEVDFWNAWCR